MIDMVNQDIVYSISAKKLLIKDGENLLCIIHKYRNAVRAFYYEVILSKHKCPVCHGKLEMVGTREAKCMLCNQTLDPTLVFQESSCCGKMLILKYTHYSCSHCNKTIPSKFVFDERIFDKSYFKKMMRDSRDRAKRRQEEIRRLMVESMSGALEILDEPILENVPGLIGSLDNFIQADIIKIDEPYLRPKQAFIMAEYKDHILRFLGWGKLLFSNIAPLQNNSRQDRIWRFVTLIFMQQDGEVELIQNCENIWVKKSYNEAY
ncbi:hypothetical protein ACFL0Q_08325 [Thermodesulfobacteriota bacterium]